jgi:hypothetical protein
MSLANRVRKIGRLRVVILLLCIMLPNGAVVRSETSPKNVQSVAGDKVPDPAAADLKFYRYKLNMMLGVHFFSGTAPMMGGQLGYAFFSGIPFYFGPEISFSLFNGSSLMDFFAGGWFELHLINAPRLSFTLGAVAGPSLASNFSNLPPTNLGAYFDACIVQEFNDLVSFRGQFRPGYLAGNFAFMLNLNVSFRFL